MAVAAPVFHIRAFADIDVTEGRVAGVGGTGQQLELAVDLAGEEHRVAVEGQEGVFHSGESLEIGGLGHADGSAVGILAPDDVIGVLHLYQARVIGVGRHEGVPCLVDELNLFVFDVPVDGVLAAAQVDIGDAVGLLATEHADISALIGHNGGVEDAGHAGDGIAADDRVFGVAPQGGGAVCGFVLPGNVGQSIAVEFDSVHNRIPPEIGEKVGMLAAEDVPRCPGPGGPERRNGRISP